MKLVIILADLLPTIAFCLFVISFSSYYYVELQEGNIDIKLVSVATFLLTIGMYFGKGGKVRNTGISWCILGAFNYAIKECTNTMDKVTINDYMFGVLILMAPFFVHSTQSKQNVR